MKNININFYKDYISSKIALLRKYNNFILPGFAGFLLLFTIFALISHKKQPIKEPYANPPMAQYETNNVSGIGIIEPYGRLYKLGTNSSGLVAQVNAQIGQIVKKDDTLLSLDNRDLEAQIESLRASLKTTRIMAEQAKRQFTLVSNIVDKRAISQDEYITRKFNSESANSRIIEIEQQIKSIEATRDMRIIKAPIDGTILQINTRAGEFILNSTADDQLPVILMGDVSKLQVRTEVDEEFLNHLQNIGKAKGRLRGDGDIYFDLKFLYFEPYVAPKNTLNVMNKRIDTRVVQVVFEIINDKNIDIRNGQQMDVYIKSNALIDDSAL